VWEKQFMYRLFFKPPGLIDESDISHFFWKETRDPKTETNIEARNKKL